MPDFIFALKGGKPVETDQTPEQLRAKWFDWVKDMGGALANPGTPVGKSKTVTFDGVRDDGGPEPLMGYVIAKADNIDAAVEMAKTCPHVFMGDIEIAELKEMPPPD